VSEYTRELFDDLGFDDRQALYHGDIDLDDVFDEELSSTDKRELKRLIKSWGDRVLV
jgi:hypothetical protein